MSGLVKILRAAHCHNTHHLFAIDALSEIETERGRRLAGVLLKFHSAYLNGAKAPDTKFKDFKNHVLHVAEGWGGAVEQANRWYAQLIGHLDAGQWSAAAFAAGVLSHYFTDPIMPLHTAQSEVEDAVHRPMEWSIFKSYDDIRQEARSGNYDFTFQLANYGEWLQEAIVASARIANQFYETVIGNFDLAKAIDDPVLGLNKVAHETLAQLFGLALIGWARVLERAAEETSHELPLPQLAMTSLLAAVDMPYQSILKRVRQTRERRAVVAIYREYESTGQVARTLPEEIAQVRQARAEDPRLQAVATSSGSDFAPNDEEHSEGESILQPEDKQTIDLVSVVDQTVDRQMKSPQSAASGGASLAASGQLNVDDPLPVVLKFPTLAPKEPLEQPIGSALRSENPSHFRLGLDSDIIDAPSIGPATAERLRKVGIRTVGDLLNWNAAVLSIRLDAHWIRPSTIERWKSQAHLLCEIVDMQPFEAQILVLSGITGTRDLAGTNPAELSQRIAAAAATPEGESFLRGRPAPSSSQISRWISFAARRAA